MDILIERTVISGILSHALVHKKEVSGLLLGPNPSSEKISVSDFVVYQEVGQEDQVEIPASFLAKTRQDLEEKGGGKYIIGWYHSHPHRNAFISRTDERTQMTLQQFNSNFISLNVAFREEDGGKSKLITEVICYRLGSDGKPQYFPLQFKEKFSSEVALGEINADIENVRKSLENLKSIANSDELRREFILPITKFNLLLNRIILKMAQEMDKLEFGKLPDIEEKSKKIENENENVKQKNLNLEEELRKTNETVKYLQDTKVQKEKDEQNLRKELETFRNECIKRGEENKKLRDENKKVMDEKMEFLRRISKLESDNSELQKRIKDLESERDRIPVFKDEEMRAPEHSKS